MSDGRRVKLGVPLPPYGLSLNGRVHWRKRNVMKQAYVHAVQPIINAACNPPPLWERAHVTYDWHSIRQVDADNAIGRMKAALDCLEGVAFVNDRDVTLSFGWHRVSKRSEERVEISVEEIK